MFNLDPDTIDMLTARADGALDTFCTEADLSAIRDAIAHDACAPFGAIRRARERFGLSLMDAKRLVEDLTRRMRG